VAFKKPSELLNRKKISGVFENPEISLQLTETYDKFLNNFEKINSLSEKVNLKTSAGCLFGRGLLFSKNNPSFVISRRMMSSGRIVFLIIPDKNFIDDPGNPDKSNT